MEKTITTQNFMKSTNANFTPCVKPEREPDFTSPSGSQYWYIGQSVVRFSDHWGDVASCRWYIDGTVTNTPAAGVCNLADFLDREAMPLEWHQACRVMDHRIDVLSSLRGSRGFFLANPVALKRYERELREAYWRTTTTRNNGWNAQIFAPIPNLDLSIYA